MKDLNNQTSYWDSVASDKTFTHPVDMEKFSSFVQPDKRILDYGCGYGRICEALWAKGYREIVGFDTSQAMIKRGKSDHPRLHLQVFPTEIEDSSFDAIILMAVLTCIPENDAQKSLISDIHRMLRPGGIVFISDYWLQRDDRNRQRYDDAKDKYETYGIFELSEGAIFRHHERQWIEELMADFGTIDLIDIDVFTMNGHEARAFQYFGRKKES
jgi:SAM-dependent methyltransferase